MVLRARVLALSVSLFATACIAAPDVKQVPSGEGRSTGPPSGDTGQPTGEATGTQTDVESTEPAPAPAPTPAPTTSPDAGKKPKDGKD